VAKKPLINARSLRAVSLSAALAFGCQSSAVYAQSATGSNLGLSMTEPAASDFGAVKPPEVPLRELPVSPESAGAAGVAGVAPPLNGSVPLPGQPSDTNEKKADQSGVKSTGKSGVKAGAKSTDKAAAKAGTAAASAKSVSMASPLAPPLQPMLDTSTPAKPNAKPATGPSAAPGGNGSSASSSASSAASSFARQGLAPGLPTPSPSPALPGWPNSLPSSTGASGAFAANNGTPSGNVEDNYPVIGTLETSIFGSATPAVAIEERLAKLENTVYKKSFASESLFERTERLKATLLGLQSQDPDPNAPGGSSRFIESSSGSNSSYFDAIAALPENQSEVEPAELQRYFFMLVNGERQKFGYSPLEPDQIATKLASDHASELGLRRALSHQDLKGNNPDRRYTLAGGNDLLYESIVSINNDTGAQKPTRAMAVNLLKTIMNRQDEREALMASDATGLGFAIEWSKGKEKIFACSDVLTRHGVIQPIPTSVQVGDKVDVRGVVMPPFHFDKITVAWEGPSPGMASIADDSEEALPYFAPLDYAAYAHHSDNDHQGTITALKTAGIIAAIAGGVFIPPVALAAPLIAMSGSNSEPKPASDIPIKGGVHVDGNAFDGRIAINHEGKEGIYYITVWASLTKYGKPIAISRRAIVATAAGVGGNGNVAQGGPARSLSNGNEVDAEKVSAQVVDDNGAPAISSKPAKTKHKHKQSQQPQDPNL
jgi:uncharacterized protein YkwD